MPTRRTQLIGTRDRTAPPVEVEVAAEPPAPTGRRQAFVAEVLKAAQEAALEAEAQAAEDAQTDFEAAQDAFEAEKADFGAEKDAFEAEKADFEAEKAAFEERERAFEAKAKTAKAKTAKAKRAERLKARQAARGKTE